MHRLHRGQDVALRPPQRRESEQRQLRLQLPDIVPAQRQVMRQIPRAAAMRVIHGQSAFEQGSFGREHVRVKRRKFRGKPFQQRLAFRQRLI